MPHTPPAKSLRQAGYTLIELLVYSAMISVLLTAVIGFLTLTIDARVKAETITQVDLQGAFAMDYITQTIRNATSITTPAAAGSGASLTLVVPTGSLSPTIFDLSGSSALEVKEGTAAYVPLTSNDLVISSLTFKNLTRSGSSGIVQVSFVVGHVNPSSQNVFDYQKTFTDSAEIGW
jgi:prepilin-type N-terminal cleavage/methylation domain-containing protein